MFVRANNVFKVSSSSVYQLTKKYSAQAFFSKNDNVARHQQILMSIGMDFEKQCQPLNAERVYKAIIDLYPACREAYQKLWNSWVTVHGLKITEKEFNEFEEKYRKYIQPNENLIDSSCQGYRLR